MKFKFTNSSIKPFAGGAQELRAVFKVIRMILALTNSSEKRILSIIFAGQILTSFIELVALAVVGATISLIIRTTDGQSPGDRVSRILSTLHLESVSIPHLILIFSTLSLLFFVIRTVVSVLFAKQSLKFAGHISAKLSRKLVEHFLADINILKRFKYNQQEISFAVTGGSVRLVQGTLGSITLLSADLFLLIIVISGLFFVDIESTLFMLLYFTIIAVILHRITNARLRLSSRRTTETNLDSSNFFLETLVLYRELNLRNMIQSRLERFSNYRESFAQFQAYIQFLPLLSKYILEIGVILGISAIALVQVLEFDFSRSAATLGLFVVAGSRLAPGIFRLQQNLSSLFGTHDATKVTQVLLSDYLQNISLDISVDTNQEGKRQSINFPPAEVKKLTPYTGSFLKVQNLGFSFLDFSENRVVNEHSVLKDINFSLMPNTITALIGKSGEGKSTLIDLIIGAKKPSKGIILIDGIQNMDFIRTHPGSVGFVPQTPEILQGSLAFNISLKEKITQAERKRIEDILIALELKELLQGLPEGIDTKLNFGNKVLSGGQLQRLSLARAVFTFPTLLIVDEYTSALDEASEKVVSSFVREISSKCTVLIITHRVSTMDNCDKFLVLAEGNCREFDSLEVARKNLG